MRTLEVYTDGSCVPNPGVGGWGWVSYEKKDEGSPTTVIRSYGGLKKTTNNQMELMAMAEFLESCPGGICVNIYSDSQCVLGGIVGKDFLTLTRVEANPQGRMKRLLRAGSGIGTPATSYWNKEIKNSNEWYRIHQALLKLAKQNTVLSFCWVKGHSKVEGNEEADKLSNLFRKEQ